MRRRRAFMRVLSWRLMVHTSFAHYAPTGRSRGLQAGQWPGTAEPAAAPDAGSLPVPEDGPPIKSGVTGLSIDPAVREKWRAELAERQAQRAVTDAYREGWA
jgi:hypothetical protein